MRIPHGVTAFGVGAATTSYILQQQKAEAQKKENALSRGGSRIWTESGRGLRGPS